MSLFRFFTKQSSDDPIKIINLIDEDKPISKRYNFMISYITKLIKPDEKFSFRLYDFFKEHGETVEQLCVTHICLLDSKFRIKSWEEVNNSFSILQELSRYGHCKKIESIQNISKALLQDGNRIELKKAGLSLTMNLISHNENLKIPFEIFLASVDLSLFDIGSSAQLANREILSKQDFKWLSAIKDLAKGLPTYSYGEIVKISKMILNYEMVKESLILFKNILENTLDGGVCESGINSFAHFRKWFNILKRSYFLYLYPDLVEENYGRGLERCPDIIHYIVIIWVKKFITIDEINSMFFLNESDRTFILKVLQKSFLWLGPNSEISLKSAISTYKILKNWMNYVNYPTLKEISKETFSIMCLKQISYIFQRKSYQFNEMTDICLRSLELFKIFNQNFKDNPKFFALLLEICEEIDSGKENEKLLENFSLFLFKTLNTVNLLKMQNLSAFEMFLHKWCNKFVIIFQIWKKCLLGMIDSSKSFENLVQTSMFLPLFKLIGSGIDFESDSQASWASAVHELILNMLEKKFSPFEILKYFFHDLSKVILQGARDSSTISLHTICQVFMKNTQESPSQLQTRHFFYLIAESVNKSHLVEMILRHSSIILDYKGMHSLIYKLLTFACENQHEGLQAVFRVFALPNYYKMTPLIRINDSKSTYLALKGKIFEFFLNDSFASTPVSFIDGLAIFLIEEIGNKCFEYVDEGVNLLLKYCQNSDLCISSTALQNISIVAPFIPDMQLKILEFLVSQVMKPKKIDKENFVINIFYTVVRIFMNRAEPIDEGILKLLFQRIAKFGVLAGESSKLRAYLSSMVSFLGFYYSNFPLVDSSVDVFDSGLEAGLEKSHENFVLNKTTILTVFKDKFIIRNEFGKFLWTCQHFSIFNSENFSDDKNSLKKILSLSQISYSSENHSEMLKNSPSVEFLIKWIQKTYEEEEKTIFNPPESLETPENPPVVPKSERKQTSFIEKEEKIENFSKIFISNLGLDPHLTRLENNEKLERSLNLLDGVKAREHVKLGVIYVKPGQDNEKEILANSSCSLEFKEFLKKIGKPVELERFSCYLGSLDQKGSCGKVSLAYVDWEYEVMYHVPVMMPTDPNDPQQVAKKRHVGNDNVNIVWSENSREYRIDTIVTHLIFVNIIIYPIEPQLFKVSIHNKLNVNFGPLRDGMVVTWKTLPYLVRTTAINADRAVRMFKFPHFERQTEIRLKKIIEIYEDNSTEKYRKAKTIV
jgi:hypothetical protein